MTNGNMTIYQDVKLINTIMIDIIVVMNDAAIKEFSASSNFMLKNKTKNTEAMNIMPNNPLLKVFTATKVSYTLLLADMFVKLYNSSHLY